MENNVLTNVEKEVIVEGLTKLLCAKVKERGHLRPEQMARLLILNDEIQAINGLLENVSA